MNEKKNIDLSLPKSAKILMSINSIQSILGRLNDLFLNLFNPT